MEQSQILFVDDEPNILAGLKRMLRPLRDQFVVYFAESGAEALEILDREKVEVVVSDMRMPMMDGAELLQRVKNEYPQAIRIMLTGQADEESVMRTVGVVHQFLAKPCDPEKLKGVLQRAVAQQRILANPQLRDRVSAIGSLPALPSLYTKLQEVLRDPDATIHEVGEVIEQDISMTAKLLQLVNSSFYGVFQKVDKPARAVSLLGLETIKTLVLGAKIFDEARITDCGLSMDYLWRHSLGVAQLSRAIAGHISQDKELIDNAFLAGMLHDLGRLLFISHLAEQYRPVIAESRDQQLSLTGLEQQHFHATHAQLGGYLTGLWGFQGNVVEAITFHHKIESYPVDHFSEVHAVHLADVFYYEHHPDEIIGSPPILDLQTLGSLGLAEQLPRCRELAEEILV